MAEEECFFKWKFNCENKSERLIESGSTRIETIIKCSKIYHDGINEQLEESVHKNNDFTIKCHKNCASTYTSTTQIQRYLKRQKQEAASSPIPPKKTRRSGSTSFSFQQNCIFCGEVCNLDKDLKNPARWRQAYLCREIEKKGDNKTLKQSILEVCDRRNDEWAASVRVCVEGTISDLHAADARYHVDCRSKFMSPKSVASAAKSRASSKEVDGPLESLIAHIQEDLSCIWNSVELVKAYREHGGNKLSCKLLVQHLSDYFGEDLLVLSSAGIASIIVF